MRFRPDLKKEAFYVKCWMRRIRSDLYKQPTVSACDRGRSMMGFWASRLQTLRCTNEWEFQLLSIRRQTAHGEQFIFLGIKKFIIRDKGSACGVRTFFIHALVANHKSISGDTMQFT